MKREPAALVPPKAADERTNQMEDQNATTSSGTQAAQRQDVMALRWAQLEVINRALHGYITLQVGELDVRKMPAFENLTSKQEYWLYSAAMKALDSIDVHRFLREG